MSEECDRTELRLDNERPNSGLREGEISHVGVNDALRVHLKMVIFGQQTRLRGRVLLEDEKLVRFHAGHDLVRFFYGGVRQLPEVLKLADLAGMADLKQLDFEVENALRYSNDEGLLKGLADIFYDHYLQLDRVEADFNTYLLGQILKKLDLHPRYREVFVPQYEHLVGG